MYANLLKETLFLLLAFLDAEFTKRKLAEWGVEKELNGVVRKLVSWFGLERGVDLGVFIPTSVFAVIGWYHPQVLDFLLGMRATLFLFQWSIMNAK